MQAQRGALSARIEFGERCGVIAAEVRRCHHDRRCIDATLGNQFAERGTHSGSGPIIVRAQPDVPGMRAHGASIYSAARDATGRALADSLARFMLCSATK